MGSGTPAPSAAAERDPRWGVPLSRPGLPNLFKVSDGLYRGAQPEAAGFPELSKLGVKTIINLRAAHSDADLIREGGMAADAFGYEPIPMFAWHAEDEDVVRFLKLVSDPSKQPVFVHCQHGADRTGLMVAIYRIAIQGWSRQDAINEMTQGGTGFHEIWGNLINYLLKLDIERLRQQAGLAAPKAAN